MAETVTEHIEETALSPKSVTVDGKNVQSHEISELIEAAKFGAAQTAATKAHFGLRFSKIVPPGAG